MPLRGYIDRGGGRWLHGLAGVPPWRMIEGALLAGQVRYNPRRPHQALGRKTPAEYRAGKLGLAVAEAA